MYVSVAEIFDSRLVAWDTELLERGTGVVKSLTPLEWLEESVA